LRGTEDSPPASQRIRSPYETEARFARKRQTDWVGYKVYLTETCDTHVPHLIVQVTTTPATVNDGEMTDTIHQSLHQHGRTPQTHLVDTAYVDVEQLETNQRQYEIDLLGSVLPDTSWQARHPEGLDSSTP
jgi:transposase